MSDQELDILAINETRLDFDIPKELVSIQGYTWISRDRNRFGGGIGLYIRNTVNCRERLDLNSNEIEIFIWPTLTTNKNGYWDTTGIHPWSIAFLWLPRSAVAI